VRGGDFLEHAAALRARAWKVPVTERTVGDHSDAVLLTPRDHGVLDRALLQMVENLIADKTTRDLPCLFKVGDIEIAHTPGENLPLALELLEGRDSVLQGVLTRQCKR
jgi:hypothetical protein